MNEESFKNNVVLPLLRSAGFDESELVFEQAFTIQLGRGKHEVRSIAGGRLDILCRSDGANLLVAELKAPREKVDATTARQAISYARLLEPIAPFVLVSNGEVSALFDAITSAPIDRINPRSDYRADIATELRLRYEALASFVGYSFENLRTFAVAHAQLALRPFSAVPGDVPLRQLAKKFVPELAVERTAAIARVLRFVREGERSVLACVGDSGCGKTVLACQLVKAIPGPTLLYSGTTLGSTLLGELAFDFNLTFSAQESDVSLLKKVASLVRAHGTRVTIIVDAIDEWRASDKLAQLDRLAILAAQLGVKVIITCKRSHWDAFGSQRGVSTMLFENLEQPVLELGKFDDAERASAIERVAKFLDLKASANVSVDDSLRHPFTLRIVAEVAARDGVALESMDPRSREVLRRFIDLSVEKMLTPGMGSRVIVALGRRLLEDGSFHCDANVLRKDLGLSLVDELPAELFLSGLLLTHTNPFGEESITFYHSHVRDYVLAIMIGRLGSLDSAARRAWIASHMTSSPGLDALLYFVATGSPDEQRDAIEALLGKGDLIAKLLSWAGEAIRVEVLIGVGSRLVTCLADEFCASASELATERVVDAILLLLDAEGVESVLVGFVEHIARAAKSTATGRQLARIASALTRFDSADCTARLLVVLRDRTVDSFVRRFIIEALESRTVDDREALFRELVAETDLDIQAWIRAWYVQLETPSLRDLLLAMHDDAEDPYSAREVCVTLSYSKLPDTAPALVDRIDTSKSEGWIFRAIARLEYREAEHRFVDILLRDPFSEIADNVLLAMFEMPCPSFEAPLLNLIENEAPRFANSVRVHWLAHAVGKCVRTAELVRLGTLLRPGVEPGLALAIALALVLSNKDELVEIVLRAAVDGILVNPGYILHLLWSDGIGPRPPHHLELIEALARQDREACAGALAFLGWARGTDPSRLAGLLRDLLPAPGNPWAGSVMWSREICQKLRVELDDWLGERIRTEADVSQFLDLARWIGGNRTIEALRIARTRVVQATSEEHVSSVEHEVYRALAGA